MTTPDPVAELYANWKKATDAYLQLWARTFEQAEAAPGATEAQREVTATLLGTQHKLREASREAFEPMVEMMGGVPLAEFRRLADAVHGLHLRLDRVDDRLRKIEEQLGDSKPRPRRRT